MYLSFSQKRQIFNSFPELMEHTADDGRVSYKLKACNLAKTTIARELSYTGNGYVYGEYIKNQKYRMQMDARGWINIKDYSEQELRDIIRRAIDSFKEQEYGYIPVKPASIKAIEKKIKVEDSFDLAFKKWDVPSAKDVFKKFLVQNDFLPIDEFRWNVFKITHSRPKSEDEKMKTMKFTEEQVRGYDGLYVYKTLEGEILYIGKGKPLKNRLISHYIESFQEVPGDTKDKRWHRFFSSYPGELLVYTKRIDEEVGRVVIEKMLTCINPPVFEGFK